MPPEDRARRIETLEQKLAEMERELATLRAGARRALVQQALMDERLITLEQNRLFRWWNQLYRAAANLYARFGSDPNYGGLSDLRTPGDYARWISHQEWELEREKIAADWQYQPRFSILLTSEDGREASLRSLEAQCYGNWGLEPGGDYVMELRAGDVLSPYALHFFAQALQRERPVMLYSDEDRIGSDGIRTDPMFKPGWSPELLRSTAYLGRSMVYRSDAKSAWTEAKAEVRHIPRVLYHGRTEHDLTVHGERTIARKTSGLSVIVCSRDVGRVRKCLGAVRRTRASDCEMIVVHHLEAGDGEQMRRCAEDLGAKWIPYRGAFHFSRMNNLGARKASAAVLLFLNDDVVVEAAGWDRTIAGALERSEIGIAGAILE